MSLKKELKLNKKPSCR